MAEQKQSEVEIVDVKKDYYASPGDEHEEGVIEAGAMTVVNAAEVSQQIATAHRYPRYPVQFRRKVFEMATYSIDVAESCIYAVPRDGKMIDGPSIRFAEILQSAWGNCRSSTEVTDVGEEFVTAEGVFFDLESNSATRAKIMRRIVGKPNKDHPNGKRYSIDGIATTGNAACSIALRNAILRGIPKALWHELFDEAKKVAGGTAQTFAARRDRTIKDLGIQGATPAMIFALLSVNGIEDIRTEHLVHLRGLQNAIKDGETTLEAAFAPREGEGKPGEAIPPRPKHSDFDRPADTKPAADKPVEQQQAKPADEQKPKETPQVDAVDEAAERATRRANDWNDQKAEWERELNTIPKVRAVGDYRDVVGAQLDDPADKKWWDGLCDARSKAIMEATRAKK